MAYLALHFALFRLVCIRVCKDWYQVSTTPLVQVWDHLAQQCVFFLFTLVVWLNTYTRIICLMYHMMTNITDICMLINCMNHRHLCPRIELKLLHGFIPRNQTRGGRSRRRRWPAGRTCRSRGPCTRSRCPACTDPPAVANSAGMD